jgi:hypothetical protein
MITRLALYATMGVVLAALDLTVDSTGFWLIMAVFWAMGQLSHRQGFEDGIVMTAQLPIESIKKIQEEIREIESQYPRDRD